MLHHLTNLISKAAHDFDSMVTQDIAFAHSEDLSDTYEWATLPIHTDDLAGDMIRYAGYLSFEEAEADHILAELDHADDQILNFAR